MRLLVACLVLLLALWFAPGLASAQSYEVQAAAPSPQLLGRPAAGSPDYSTQAPAPPESDLTISIGTTGFAWGGRGVGSRLQAPRYSRWGLEPRAFGFFPGSFLFSHGPAGNFFLLGGGAHFFPRPHFLSGFGVSHGFVLRRKR